MTALFERLFGLRDDQLECGEPAKKPTVPELIESIGIGPAQIFVLALGAGGIHFCYGCTFCCLNVISVSAAADMGVGSGARSLMVTTASTGLLIGALMASAGDALGRKACVITGYAMIATSNLLAAVTTSSWLLLVMCTAGLGFGIGFALPPSLVMLSEITPDRWKLTMRACNSIMYAPGIAFSALIAGLDDPDLQNLMWRKMLVYTAVPSTVLAILGVLFLPESPVFWAAKGQRSEACQGFQWMARWNAQESVSVDYQNVPQVSSSGTGLGLQSRLKIVFSSRYAFVLFAATLADFTLNFTEKGRTYANPQIFDEVSALPAAYQIIASDVTAQVTAILAVLIFLNSFARKVSVLLALCLMALGSFCICSAGVQPVPRSPLTESAFQLAMMCVAGGCKMGYCVLYQFAVEIFHPAVASTGSSFIIATGRIGSILAPSTFEIMEANLGWPVFYYTTATMSIISAVFMWNVPSAAELEAEDWDQVHEADAGTLLMSSSSTYGTVSKLT